MKRFLLFLSLSLGIVSCDTKDNKTAPLTFSVDSVSIPADGSSVSFIAHTKGSVWTVSPSSNWVNVNPSSGSGVVEVTVSASPNTRDETREAFLEFSMPEVFSGIMSLPVSQEGGAVDPGKGDDTPEGKATAVVTTGEVSDLGKTQVTLNASFSGASGTIADRGFYWGTSASELPNQIELDSYEFPDGVFSATVSLLQPGTVYYYKAYVTEFDAESGKYVDRFGNVRSFTTHHDNAEPPTHVTGLQYLGCYEVPAYSLENTAACSDSGKEDWGNTKWYNYKTTNPDQMIVTHTFARGGVKYRNYTLLIDKNRKAALWNAFVMNDDAYPHNVNRSDHWGYDPGIPEDWQDASASGSYNKGHMVASNYRRACSDSQNQTFYYTNQAPQNSNFNSGIWNNMENDLVKYSPSGRDTIYCVVGLLYEYGPGSQVAEDYCGETLVPSHFYTLLMRCKFNTDGVMSAAKGCAYIYKNRAPSGKYGEYITSIDSIEERAGFDFFTNVPKEFQDNAEKNINPIW